MIFKLEVSIPVDVAGPSMRILYLGSIRIHKYSKIGANFTFQREYL
jgi:hypothetical protein